MKSALTSEEANRKVKLFQYLDLLCDGRETLRNRDLSFSDKDWNLTEVRP
jgi:hypothetical protein